MSQPPGPPAWSSSFPVSLISLPLLCRLLDDVQPGSVPGGARERRDPEPLALADGRAVQVVGARDVAPAAAVAVGAPGDAPEAVVGAGGVGGAGGGGRRGRRPGRRPGGP